VSEGSQLLEPAEQSFLYINDPCRGREVQKGAEYPRWTLRKLCVDDFQAMVLALT